MSYESPDVADSAAVYVSADAWVKRQDAGGTASASGGEQNHQRAVPARLSTSISC